MFLLGGVLLLLCLLRFGRMQPLQLTNQLGHFLKLTLFISSWDNNNTRTVIARLFFFFNNKSMSCIKGQFVISGQDL